MPRPSPPGPPPGATTVANTPGCARVSVPPRGTSRRLLGGIESAAGVSWRLMAKDKDARAILDLGRNVWKLGQPEAAGVLVDAAAYYDAFYKAALQAKRSIILSGW